MLKISKLKVSVDDKEILKGVDLEVNAGEIHVIMGPNGSGKSTLAQVIMGHPLYTIVDGRLTMNPSTHSTNSVQASSEQAIDLRKLTPDKRAKLGIFMGFQHPVEIPGVSVFNVLRKATQSSAKGQTLAKLPSGQRSGLMLGKFREQLLEYASSLKLSNDFLRRSLNEGFSGGEKKRSEILQMLALKPKLVILDEIDSGLDVDGLKLVASAIKRHVKETPYTSFIVITHYARILRYLKPDFVHVMVEGKIVKSGKLNLAKEIEEKGYQSLQNVIARNEETKQSIVSS